MLILPAIVVFVSSFVAGLSGFGYSLIAVPLLLLFFSPKIVIPIIVLHAFVLNLVILRDSWKSVDIKKILPLMIFGVVGTPVGAYILMFFPVDLIKVGVGITIVIFSICIYFGVSRKFKNEKLVSIPVGFMSGVLNGSTAMSGPPIILFYANQHFKKKVFRANLVVYFLFLNLFTLPVLMFSNVYSGEVLIQALKLLPSVIVGSTLGVLLVGRVKGSVFRKFALILVFLSGVYTLVTGMGWL